MLLGQLLQDEVLGEVRVLILIDKDVVEPGGNGLLRFSVMPKQYIHIQQYVIEVHDS